MIRRAFITGASGQDGLYLTQYLRSLGIEVFGGTRDSRFLIEKAKRFHFDLPNQIVDVDLLNDSAKRIIFDDCNPDVIFHLSGQSSVKEAEKNPKEASESIVNATERLFHYANVTRSKASIVNVASSECFGTIKAVVDSSQKLNPESAYASAKAHTVELARVFRKKYGADISNVFVFPHESHVRDDRFLVGRILKEVAVSEKEDVINKLSFLSGIDGLRDIGLACEYSKGYLMVATQGRPLDTVLGTGQLNRLSALMQHLMYSLIGFDDLKREFDASVDIEASGPSNCAASVEEQLSKLGWSPGFKGKEVMEKIAQDYFRLRQMSNASF